MARNREKANLLMNRWTSMKEEVEKGGGGADRRPYLASEVRSLPDAEKWRREVLREVSRKVAEIQNSGLGEARLRDLNDEINKLLREKTHWERQIRALGGPDYAATAPRLFDAEGREAAGGGGYRYFGAAKDLPGVRELFAEGGGGARGKARTRAEVFRGIRPDYYGYRDEEDAEMVAAEAAAERALVAEAEAAAGAAARKRPRAADAAAGAAGGVGGAGEGSSQARSGGSGGAAEAASAPAADDDDDGDDDVGVGGASGAAAAQQQREIDAALLERKRAALLAKYAGGGGARA